MLICIALYIIGEKEDAPGLVLIGIVVAVVLVFFGIYNAQTGVKKGLIPASLCFLLSAFDFIWMIVLSIEGEFRGSPLIIVFAGIICIGLLITGIRLIKNNCRR